MKFFQIFKFFQICKFSDQFFYQEEEEEENKKIPSFFHMRKSIFRWIQVLIAITIIKILPTQNNILDWLCESISHHQIHSNRMHFHHYQIDVLDFSKPRRRKWILQTNICNFIFYIKQQVKVQVKVKVDAVTMLCVHLTQRKSQVIFKVCFYFFSFSFLFSFLFSSSFSVRLPLLRVPFKESPFWCWHHKVAVEQQRKHDDDDDDDRGWRW